MTQPSIASASVLEAGGSTCTCENSECAGLRFARLWAPADVCWYLGIGTTRLGKLREDDRTFPMPLVLPGGRLIRWVPAAVVAWALGEPVTPAPTPSPRRKPGRKPRQ